MLPFFDAIHVTLVLNAFNLAYPLLEQSFILNNMMLTEMWSWFWWY